MRRRHNHFFAELLYASPDWKAPKNPVTTTGFNRLICRIVRIAKPLPKGADSSNTTSLYSYRRVLKATFPLAYTWLCICGQRVRFAHNAGQVDFSFHPFVPATTWPPATTAAFRLTHPPGPSDYLKAKGFGTGATRHLYDTKRITKTDRAIIIAYSYGLPLPAIAQILRTNVQDIDHRMADIISILMQYELFTLWALDGDYMIAIPPSIGRFVEAPSQRPIPHVAHWRWRDQNRPIAVYLRLQILLDATIRRAKLTVNHYPANLLYDLWNHPVIAAQVQLGEPLVRAYRWGEKPDAL